MKKSLTALFVFAALMLVPASASATDCSKNDYYGCGTPLGDFLHKLFGNTSTSLMVAPEEGQSGVDIQAHSSHPNGFTLRAGVGALEVMCTGVVTDCSRSTLDHDLHFHVDTGYEFDTGPISLSVFARTVHLEGGHFGWGTGAEASVSRRGYVRAVWLHDLEDPYKDDLGKELLHAGEISVYYGFRF